MTDANYSGQHKTCRSWLASDSGLSANKNGDWPAAIASKPAPTGAAMFRHQNEYPSLPNNNS
jgi:hypothetical protein